MKKVFNIFLAVLLFLVACNPVEKHSGPTEDIETDNESAQLYDDIKARLIKNGIPELPSSQLLRRRVQAPLSNHKLYDLRTTFYTRCDEYGVAAPARDEFVGHSAGALTNAYRDLADEYLLREGKKLNEWK